MWCKVNKIGIVQLGRKHWCLLIRWAPRMHKISHPHLHSLERAVNSMPLAIGKHWVQNRFAASPTLNHRVWLRRVRRGLCVVLFWRETPFNRLQPCYFNTCSLSLSSAHRWIDGESEWMACNVHDAIPLHSVSSYDKHICGLSSLSAFVN